MLCCLEWGETWGEEQINTPSHDWAKHGSSAQPPLCQFWVQGCTSLWIVHEVAVYTIGLRRQIMLYVHAWLPHLFQRCMFLEEELLLHCSFELQTWCDTAMLPGLSFPCPAFHVSFVVLCCHLASFQQWWMWRCWFNCNFWGRPASELLLLVMSVQTRSIYHLWERVNIASKWAALRQFHILHSKESWHLMAPSWTLKATNYMVLFDLNYDLCTPNHLLSISQAVWYSTN